MNQDIRRSEVRNMNQNVSAQRTSWRSKKILMFVATFVLLAIAVVIYLIFVQKSEDLDSVVTIKNRVERHMILPENEEPALATITDREKVTTPFLEPAENGDKMLIYQEAMKVILYRPSTDRIVDVGPVSIATPSNQ